MAYRPLGWVKYHKRFPSLSGNEYNPNSIQTPLTMEQAFEAGADAILTSLIESGIIKVSDLEALNKHGNDKRKPE